MFQMSRPQNRSLIPKPSRRGWEYHQKTSIFQRVSRRVGGAEGNRTPDLCSAIAALSHLSYGPGTGAIYVAGPGIVKERRGAGRGGGLRWSAARSGTIPGRFQHSRMDRAIHGRLRIRRGARENGGRRGRRIGCRGGAGSEWRDPRWIAGAGPLWQRAGGITHDGHLHGPRVPRCSSCSASSVP